MDPVRPILEGLVKRPQFPLSLALGLGVVWLLPQVAPGTIVLPEPYRSIVAGVAILCFACWVVEGLTHLRDRWRWAREETNSAHRTSAEQWEHFRLILQTLSAGEWYLIRDCLEKGTPIFSRNSHDPIVQALFQKRLVAWGPPSVDRYTQSAFFPDRIWAALQTEEASRLLVRATPEEPVPELPQGRISFPRI
jgi:hypothetical protein